MVSGLLVFDMDGVLVEVSESYRETIVQTVKHFSGRVVSRDLIQEYKNRGGWNDDWSLSRRLLADLGHEVPYPAVVERFNRIFFGEDGLEGLIRREVWLDTSGVLARLSQRYRLAIFTGRRHYELKPTLDRFAGHLRFDPIVTADDVSRLKPHPEGLIKIRSTRRDQPMWYLGDTVDDARSAHAAHLPFIGVVAKDHSRRAEVIELFRAEEAVAIIDDINQLERVLP
jgi:HAD superfamily phosphatase